MVGEIANDQEIPLFSGAVKHGNTLYIAGKSAHFDGDIKAHTNHVLNVIQEELEKMELNGKSFKVNVTLVASSYHKMNGYRGRFEKSTGKNYSSYIWWCSW